MRARGAGGSAPAKRLLRRMAGPRLIRAFGRRYPTAFFVEIGANDGEQHDHLRPLILDADWRGLMVEPVPYVFERLRRQLRRRPRVTLENAAIADRDGELPFLHLVDAGPRPRDAARPGTTAIGSFSRETMLGHATRIPDIEQRMVTTVRGADVRVAARDSTASTTST